ncbi:MAG: hypothetical protein IPL08_19295 [Saprospiraceae bacterium]|nr:hypothetical protein [Saprospiraceae bacterium]MBK8669411.1 hypothetical protein [Saprospiraceae bacterium]MBL0100747.1 hypothetical protein [Saprospiraceae bacterium]
MKSFILTSFTLCSLVFCSFSCSKPDSKENCPEDLFCTEVFVSIGISVRDSNGKDVLLSKVVSTIQSSGITYTYIPELPQSQNLYTIINDLQLKNLQKSGSEVIVEGFVKNAEKDVLFFTEKYTIGHDCCHVIKIEGKDVIVIK